jgi:5S rRNA maturation endonuclease (ribonuclease M5)
VISLKLVSDFVFHHFENVTVSKHNTHFHARCSLCGDSKKNKRKKRFHLDWKMGNPVFQCWNCGESGSFVYLYSLIHGITEEDAKKEIFSKYEPASLIERMTQQNKVVKKEKAELSMYNYILDECASESLHVDSIQWNAWVLCLNEFRHERKIPKDIELLYAWKGDYKGRIIIPIRDEDDNIIYFQGRRRFDNDDSVVKYKNPVTEKTRIILNKHKFDPEKSIIAVEGLIDAFMIGDQGTTMLGKELHDDFFNELIQLTNKHVIIAFDNDEEGRKSLRKYLEVTTHPRLRFFLMPEKYKNSKDINKLKVDHNIQNVYDFIVENSFTKVKCRTLLALGGKR